MNKIDLFAAKLPKVPLEKFFSDFTGKLAPCRMGPFAVVGYYLSPGHIQW